jgi:hypothetical protein
LTVGDGGAGKHRGVASDKGADSTITGSFGTIVAEGGGGTSGGHDHGQGLGGGSGGGAAAPNKSINKGGLAGTSSSLGGFEGKAYGTNGGSNTTIRNGGPTNASGGGGAKSPGLNTDPNGDAGKGGDGVLIKITGVDTYYAGGGGGGGHEKNGGAGGLGGGGKGSAIGDGLSGEANTGSGGGGGAWSEFIGGKGGSGIVIVRVKMIGEVVVSNVVFSRQNIQIV